MRTTVRSATRSSERGRLVTSRPPADPRDPMDVAGATGRASCVAFEVQPLAPADVGGVHVKYLHHCPRQLWLYSRGYRPEAGSDLVAFGQAVDETSFQRKRRIALDSARIDWVDGRLWVHEVKSARTPDDAHIAQVRLYCLLLW